MEALRAPSLQRPTDQQVPSKGVRKLTVGNVSMQSATGFWLSVTVADIYLHDSLSFDSCTLYITRLHIDMGSALRERQSWKSRMSPQRVPTTPDETRRVLRSRSQTEVLQ